ncbi:X-linked lymphocyte-regulated protein 5C-like [Acomys russatus]|uniref:X-linked lymphocyte-regulated protein 5C-like n=1 Tax=Acomys russatus TaxID=60746 RepID=UPI0021E2D3BA|nr:X-linked lymphocyte-regulated protein 5C-like [Acomys russatus]
MEQNVIAPGGLLMSPSRLLLAPALVPGHMAKAMERSAKRPRVDGTLPSDDSQNCDPVTPEDNPADDISELGSCSSGSDVQEARESVEKRIQDVKGDIARFLMAKKKQFKKDINASFRSLNENLQSIFQTQQKSRQEHHSNYSEMCGPIYQKWLEDMERAREQEEQLALITQHQMEILETVLDYHETKLENSKEICDTFLKKAKDLSEHRQTFIGGGESEVEKEISKAQDRVLMETQEQDVSLVETYLQSLILDRSEETI